MLPGFEILDVAASGPLLIGIPESVSLLGFGIGLISAAVILRWVLGRRDETKRDGNPGEER